MANTPEATFQRTPDWLLVVARGTMDVAWFIAMTGRVAQEMRDAPANAVLVDARELVGPLSDMDRYDIGVGAAQHGLRVPVAVLGKEPLIDPRRLGEIVARNRSVNVRTFTDYDAACTWLREQTAKASRPGGA